MNKKIVLLVVIILGFVSISLVSVYGTPPENPRNDIKATEVIIQAPDKTEDYVDDDQNKKVTIEDVTQEGATLNIVKITLPEIVTKYTYRIMWEYIPLNTTAVEAIVTNNANKLLYDVVLSAVTPIDIGDVRMYFVDITFPSDIRTFDVKIKNIDSSVFDIIRIVTVIKTVVEDPDILPGF